MSQSNSRPPFGRRLLAALLTSSLTLQPLFAHASGPLYVYQVPYDAPNMRPATQGRLALSQDSHAFGTLVVGSRATVTFTLKNMGQDAVRVTGIDLGAPYTQVNNCPVMLAGGATCQLTATFAPGSAGEFSSLLTVQAEAGGQPANAAIALSGSAVIPTTGLAIVPNAVDFGGVALGSAAPVKSLTITNFGNSPATITGIGLDGESDFSQSNDCAQPLAPGAHCNISVAFTPAVYGARSANLMFFEQSSNTLYPVALTGTGNGAVMSTTPATATLPLTVIGSTSTQKVTVANTGNLPLQNLSASLDGGGSEFTLGGPQCGPSLAAGATCDFTVTYAPSTPGPKSTTLTVSSANGGTRTTALTASAAAQAPAISATPQSASFSPVAVGTAAPVQQLKLKNSGNVPVNVTGLSIVAGQADFAQSNDCATLPVGAECTVSVSFTPSVRGARGGKVYLQYGASELLLDLTGQGLQGVASVSPASADFGSVQVGQLAPERTLTLTNTGDAPLNISSVAVPTSDFGVTSNCTTVAAGANCSITTTFKPTTLGVKAESVTITTDAGPQQVALTGNGVKGYANASPTSLTYQPQQVGSTSAGQTVTVRNTGTSPLTITGLSVIAGAADFAQSNDCASLPVGASCHIDVTFTPSASDTRSGTIAMAHDGEGVTTVALNGEGRVPSAAMNTVSFPSTPVGQSSTAVATLSNTGVGTLSVVPPTAGPAGGSAISFTSTTCGTSLAPGASCNSTLTFSPKTAGLHTGVFSINTGAGLQSTNLAATAIQGSASVTPSSLTFTSTQVASTSTAQTVVVKNTGTSTLTFTGIGLIAGSTDFGQSNNCASLAVGESCSVSVAFTPTAAGERRGTLALTHDGSGVSVVDLTGTGQSQAAVLTPPSFAPTAVGASSTAAATLTNTGIGPLAVTNSASVSGAGYSFVSSTCGAQLAPNATCSVVVRFSPTSTTQANGQLSLLTGAGQLTAVLGSTGIQGFASVSPSSLTFAAQQVGASSTSQTVTVTNTGTNVLTFTGVGVATGTSDFAQSNNCGAVPVNGKCTVTVSFTPSTTGVRTGTLAFTHDGGGIAAVNLTGTGQAASASLTLPAFAPTQVGQSNSAVATLANTGLAPLNVTVPSAVSVSGPDFQFVDTNCAGSLAAGANCTVTVRFTAANTSPSNGSLTVTTSAGVKTAALTATGRAQSVTLSSADNFNFNVPQNTWSGHFVGVLNTGVGPVTVNSLTYTTTQGSFNAWWVPEGGHNGWYCNPGMVIQPGEYCGAWANADGVQGSVHSGTVTFNTSAGDVVHHGSLTVRGLSYNITTGATTAPTAGQTGTLYNLAIVNNTQFSYYFPMYTMNKRLTDIGRFTGGDADKFVITGTTCNGTLPPYSTCTVAVAAKNVGTVGKFSTSFQPNGNHQQSGDGNDGAWWPGQWLGGMGWDIIDVYNAPPTPVDVTIQAPSLTLSYPNHPIGTSKIVWGTAQIGQTGGSNTFTVSNTGNAAATGMALSVPDGWVALNNTCGPTLAAGASCTFNLNFAPTQAKAYTGDLNVTASGGVQAIAYPLTGTGANPSLTMSGWDTEGGAAMGVIGFASDSGRWPRYTNTGWGPVTIKSHDVTGGFWAYQNCVDKVLQPGETCTTFNGVAGLPVGDYAGASTVTYTDQGQSTVFSTGVPNFTASVRTATVDKASVSFGAVPYQWNGPVYVRLTNNATNNVLRNLTVQFSGGSTDSFKLGNYTCSGGGLSGGEYCDLPIYFYPSTTATHTTTLVISGGYPRMQPSETPYIATTGVNIQVPLSGNGK